MRNVLVTGGAGFIGANFIHYLLRSDPDVRIVNLDALTYAGSLENLRDLPDANRHDFVRGDICDAALVERLLRERQIDTIAHFAAESHVDRSILGPALFVQTNIVGTFTLLEAARQVWYRDGAWRPGVRFHHVSTDEVFGSLGANDPAFSERTPYDPRSPYSASKAASDHLVRAYGHTYGLPYSITNCSNNYGPFQFPEKLIPLMILNALSGQPLPIYGDGRQVRDWLYVEDHCAAIDLVIRHGRPGETYVVGGGNQPCNIDVVRQVCALLDERVPESPQTPHGQLIRFVTDRPGHDRRYAMDTTRIESDLGWRPQHSLGQGLAATVDWYLSHPEWVQAIRAQGDYSAWVQKNYAGREEKE